MGEKTEGPEPVVDGNEDYTPFGPFVAVHRDLEAIAVHVPSTVDPHRHGEFRIGFADGCGRGPHVQVQAVLVLVRRPFPVILVVIEGAGRSARLPGDVTEVVAHADSFPRRNRLGSRPPEFAHRWSGVRNTFEYKDFWIFGRDALDLPSFDIQDGIPGRTGGQGQQGGQKESLRFHKGAT